MTAARLSRRFALVVSGGITIGLELVASRILTPFFGSSLYVWTAILSVTLAALAAGYYFGGRRADSIRFRESDFPYALVLGGTGLIVARTLTSFLPALSAGDLVTGSFVGSLFVLGPTLGVLSALNPLLIAIERETSKNDSGGGFVFAISTVGSIAGAIVTSYLILPYFRGLDVLLLFAAITFALAVATALFCRQFDLPMASCMVVAIVFGVQVYIHTDIVRKISSGEDSLTLLKDYHSAVGDVSVIRAKISGHPAEILYAQNGGVESSALEDGTPFALYGYMIDQVMADRSPAARSALILGLAGGSIPWLLHRRGVSSDAVDINPDAVRIASDYFHFDAAATPVSIADARMAERRCNGGRKYDSIVLDVFSGMDPVPHMATVEAFEEAASCLNPGGSIIVNVVGFGLDTALVRVIAAGVNAGTGQPVWAYVTPAAAPGGPRNIILVSGGTSKAGPAALQRGQLGPEQDIPLPDVIAPQTVAFTQADRLEDAIDRSGMLFAREQIALRQAYKLHLPLGW